MFTSGTSPLTPLRASLWHFLLFAGVAWLAIAWSMLRLEPSDAVRVAGPVVLFGAVSEALRALTGSGHWGLHCGLTVLFAATGAVLVLDDDASFATPAALLGWYLLVRGAADIALASSVRGVERSWGVLMVLGVAQVGAGFYAASSYARSAGAVVWLLAGLAVMRAVADLVTAMDLRDSPAGRSSRERAAGVAGYAAGLADYAAAATGRASRPRHRARGLLAGRPAEDDAEHAADMETVMQVAGVGGADGRLDGDPTATGRAGATIDGGTVDDGARHSAAFPIADAAAATVVATGMPRQDRAGTDATGTGMTGTGSTGTGSMGPGSTGIASTGIGSGDWAGPEPAAHRVAAGPPVGMSIHGGHRGGAGGPADGAEDAASRRHGEDADRPERVRAGFLRHRAGDRRSS